MKNVYVTSTILFFCVGLSSSQLLKVRSNVVDALLKPNLTVSSDLDILKLKKAENQTTTTERVSTTSTAPKLEKIRSSCGVRFIQHTELIRNGIPTKPGDWPWHVALYRMNAGKSNLQYICGGTLINQFQVITAAHCVIESRAPILPERLLVVAGKNNLVGSDGDPQERTVFSITVHPSFSRATLNYDVAILKLSSGLAYSNYIQPVCLWDREDNDKKNIFNKLGTVVGFGLTEEDKLSSQLLTTRIPIIDDVECIKSNPLFYSKFVNDYSYCAGFKNGTSVCNGDSGSGMFFLQRNNNEDTWFLRGLVSLSVSRQDTNICDPNEYTVFTDVAKFHEFIDENR